MGTQNCSLDTLLPECGCTGILYVSDSNDIALEKKLNSFQDMQHSVIRLSSGIAIGPNNSPTDTAVKDQVCFSGTLDRTFELHEQQDPSIDWQGFGSTLSSYCNTLLTLLCLGWNGMFRIYPGRTQKTCGSYDPRVRSWFVAATSGPKGNFFIFYDC